jgi:hypothetical protein
VTKADAMDWKDFDMIEIAEMPVRRLSLRQSTREPTPPASSSLCIENFTLLQEEGASG